jgi:hypothetical protein
MSQLLPKSGNGVGRWLLIAWLDTESSQLFYSSCKKWVGLEATQARTHKKELTNYVPTFSWRSTSSWAMSSWFQAKSILFMAHSHLSLSSKSWASKILLRDALKNLSLNFECSMILWGKSKKELDSGIVDNSKCSLHWCEGRLSPSHYAAPKHLLVLLQCSPWSLCTSLYGTRP